MRIENAKRFHRLRNGKFPPIGRRLEKRDAAVRVVNVPKTITPIAFIRARAAHAQKLCIVRSYF